MSDKKKAGENRLVFCIGWPTQRRIDRLGMRV